MFTGPNLKAADGGVNGIVRYHFPTVKNGREVNDIELVFEKGKVVKASASRNEAYLKQMLKLDPGASKLGEIAIGTNIRIQRCSKNILFDEKVAGPSTPPSGRGTPNRATPTRPACTGT